MMPFMEAKAGEQKEESFKVEVTLKVGYRYLLSLPDDFEKEPAKKWPLVVFLHGAGERGEKLSIIKKHGPPKLLVAGQKFEAIVVSPQVSPGNVWNPHGVKALVDEIKSKYHIDDDRVYLTGISMGGFGTWDTIFEYPDVFAAAIPVCGGAGVKFVMIDRIKHIPIWIFHGAKDSVVVPAYSQKMFEALTKAKAPVQFTLYPNAAHDSWTETYANPDVWTWLFQQKRGAR